MSKDSKNNISKPTVGEYKGSKILSLPTGSNYPFSFGLTKARLIIKYFKHIKRFVNENDGSDDDEGE